MCQIMGTLLKISGGLGNVFHFSGVRTDVSAADGLNIITKIPLVFWLKEIKLTKLVHIVLTFLWKKCILVSRAEEMFSE